MKILMVGVSKETQGGMYTVVENYFENSYYTNNVEVDYIPTSTVGSILYRVLFSFKGFFKVLNILRKKKYDLIHIHMSERGSVYRKGIVLNIAKIFNTKTLLHMHGADFADWYNSLSVKRQKKVKKIVNKADGIIILGEYWRNIFSEVFLDEDKIYVLHNAVPIYEVNKYNQEAKSFLFLGALIKRKGIYDILQAIKNIEAYIPEEITFDFYGPDSLGNFNDKIKEFKLEKKVFYHGWLNNIDKQTVFSKTLVNILPSYNEGLPMTILETMAYGIPNISTNVAAIPEAISNEKNGILIDAGNIDSLEKAILDMIDSENLRKKYSEESFLCINKNFSIDTHIDKLLSIYNEILE